MRTFNSTALASRFVYCVLALAATEVLAQDWPQWMGPNRDNVWQATGLVDKFPESGAKILWRAPVTNGYSGPAVANNRVFVTQFNSDANIDVSNFERAAMSGTESVVCLDASTGKEVWKQ